MNEEKKQKFFQKIQKHLEEKMGLLPSSLSSENWSICLNTRMKKTNHSDLAEYYAYLLASLSELQELIDLIVIPETWFYREERCFKLLSQYAKHFGEKYRRGTPLKILSLGCSTGEEPYSVVICLLEAGMPLGSFRVEGVDVSRTLLSIAQKGIYGQNSFRALRRKLKETYFDEVESKWQLKDEVRFSVRFKKGNIMSFPSGLTKNQYDIVLCRNLLIYLSPAIQDNLLRRLERVLTPGGILILGEAEYSKIDRQNFEMLSLNGVSCYSKKSEKNDNGGDSAPLFKDGFQDKDVICGIRKLADRGELAAAKAEIEKCEGTLGPNAELLFLKGLVFHASGDWTLAKKYFGQVVDIKPDHVEALTYLGLLTEGDEARDYRKRSGQSYQES